MLLITDLILLISVFNTVSSLLILLRWPYRSWPMSVAWLGHRSERPDLKAKEKGEPNEEAVE